MVIDKTRMRGRNRVRFTQELFYELNKGIIDPYYSFTRQEDFVDDQGRTILSLHRLYMEMEDPSEYLFGRTYFDGYDHWTKITETVFFKDTLQAWRQELALKIKAKAFANLKEQADKGNLDANKFILNSDMSNGLPANLKVPAGKRGRPSNTNVTSEMEGLSLKEEKKMLQEDLKRITKDVH